ncbi:hypothetical protein AgCh_033099 [Apium graveolens]
MSEIESKAGLLAPLSSSATNLARILSTSVNQTKISFPVIESEVAPLLFQAFITIPYLSQVSFIGTDGSFFSYYSGEKQQPLAVYSNSSSPINQKNSTKYTWYTQPVSQNTGKPYGEAAITSPSITNASTKRFASLGTSWNDSQDLHFLNTASLDGRGTISLGFRVKPLLKFLSSFYGDSGSLYLATKDGIVLLEGTIPYTRMVIKSNSVSIQLMNSNGALVGQVGNVTCQQNDSTMEASNFNIRGTKYSLLCSPLEIVGVELVYILAIPYKRPQSFVHSFNNVLVAVLLIIAAISITIIYLLLLIAGGERTKMKLRAALIQQMEASQQAERKNMNKSHALARASHDVRASLAGMSGLIELCHELVDPRSELKANLVQMEACTKDLLGILNTILDTSKIESGKIQLEEEDFDVAQLLEDVADLFYSVAMKKGVDVVLDLCDGSVTNFSHVKGDRGKLKQILCNLVSNAVKFTSEGHVSIRAYARKPTFDDSILTNSKSTLLTWFSFLYSKEDKACDDYETKKSLQRDENCMEFIFEVDDTGKGIPKEKAKSVFEDYVQVKETADGQEGTGLGLNIVQALVRLMGGEIVIKDKEVGRRGTCFKFNTYLTLCKTNGITGNAREYDLESYGGYGSGGSDQSLEQTLLRHGPEMEGTLVVLFIQSEERRKVTKKSLGQLGFRVLAVKNYEQFSSSLKVVKKKLLRTWSSSSERSDLSSKSDCIRTPTPRSSTTQKTKTVSTLKYVMIVIDTDGGSFRELSKAVAEFRKGHCSISSRIVWLDKPGARNIHFQGLDTDKLPPNDLIIFKPFHGSRLYQIFPEYHAQIHKFSAPEENKITSSIPKLPSEPNATSAKTVITSSHDSSAKSIPKLQGGIKELGGPGNEKPLGGKKVLVAEDDIVLRKIACSVISKLGASVEICMNGKEALELVCLSLNNLRTQKTSDVLPYNYIFMDCQMPIMNGFEATRRIREEEKRHGIHIPIIALSAHTSDPEIKMMIEAGMDHHIPKPVNPTKLLQVIMDIHAR